MIFSFLPAIFPAKTSAHPVISLIYLIFLILSSLLISQPVVAQKFFMAEELVVAVPQKYPPYYRLDKAGQPQGFAIDVFNAVAKRAGIQFRYQVYQTWSDVLQSIKQGNSDIIPILGVSQQRQQYLDFSSPVMTFPVSLFVRNSFQEINTSKDLGNSKVAVVKDNIAIPLLQQRKDIELVRYSSLDIAFAALISGRVDAFAHPLPVTLSLAREIDLDDKIRVLEPPVMEVKPALATAKGQEKLAQQLEVALNAFLSSAEYKRIYQKWLVEPEKSFWDVKKVFWSMAALMLVIILTFFIFRQRELLAVNASLQQQIDEATSQLSQSNEYLKDLTVTDTLTGINNRRAFEHSLNELMTRATRYQQSFSMLIFDIDEFKKLNDHYGHDMGDRVLRDLVERIQHIVRDVDILCRWGGEEFTILMPLTLKKGALKMAERCRRVIADELFDEVGSVTISLGVTCFQEDDNERMLFKRADDALYEAKAKGKNCVVWKGGDCELKA